MTIYWTNTSQVYIALDSPAQYADFEQSFIEYMQNLGWIISDLAIDPSGIERNSRYVNPLDRVTGYRNWKTHLWEWEAKCNFPKLLTDLYRVKGVVNKSLFNACTFAEKCWKNIEDRKADGIEEKWSHISLPWIGAKYGKGRILVIGINPYEAGGLEFYPKLIEEVKGYLRQGAIKINFGHKGYGGTLLWHRIGVYVKEIIKAIKDYNTSDIFLSEDEVTIYDAYDEIAFINHIKCSPKGEFSKPTKEMWKNCGQHILLEELIILEPKIILVLGIGDNSNWFLQSIFDKPPKHIATIGKTRSYNGLLQGKRIKIVTVPHPGRPAYASSDISSMVYQSMYNSLR